MRWMTETIEVRIRLDSEVLQVMRGVGGAFGERRCRSAGAKDPRRALN